MGGICLCSIGGSYSAAAEGGDMVADDVHRLKVAFYRFGALVIAAILGSLLGVMRTTPNKWLKMIVNAPIVGIS